MSSTEDEQNQTPDTKRQIVKMPAKMSCQYVWNRTFTKLVKAGKKNDREDFGDEEFFNSCKLGSRPEVYSEDDEECERNDKNTKDGYLFTKRPGVGFYCRDLPLSVTIEESNDLIWNKTLTRLNKRSEVGQVCKKPRAAKPSKEKHHKPFVSVVEEEEFKCRICDLVVAKHSNLLEHLRKAHNEKPEKGLLCFVCAKTFTSMKSLSGHIRNKHSDKPAKEVCEICSAEVVNLVWHKLIHEEPQHTCEFCSKPFRRKQELKAHIKSIHTLVPDELIPCPVCGKTFALAAYLKRHMRTHTQVKPYKCVCGEAYNFNVSLKAHKAKCVVYADTQNMIE